MKTKLTSVYYLGHTSMDRRFSNPMLPWLLREIRGLGVKDKLSVAVEDGYLKAYNDNFEPVFVHRLVDITRACQVPGRPEELIYILLNEREGLFNCYLFGASTAQEVTELFSQMREPSPAAGSPRGSTGSINNAVTKNQGFQSQSSNEHLPWNTPSISLPRNCSVNLSSDNQTPQIRTSSNASVLTSLCADLSPSESHFFEVLYIGKVRISQRKVPDSLIDDALLKFAQHEAEKVKINQLRRNSLLSSHGTTLSSNDSVESLTENKEKTDSNASTDFASKKLTLTSTSTTPLEPDKHLAWRSDESIPEPRTEDATAKPKSKIEEEFDLFSKERGEKKSAASIMKPTQTPLEPTVLILNVPSKNNLSTLKEDEERQEELNHMLTNTASSITEFCQNNFLKDPSEMPGEDASSNKSKPKHVGFKDNNPFLDDVDDKFYDDKDKDKEVEDPLIKISVEKHVAGTAHAEVIRASSIIQRNAVREDSPAPNLTFDEISRKPKMLVRSKTGLESTSDGKKNSMPENKPFLRDRSASIGTLNLKTPIAQLIGEQNRTMLFQVGRSELRLISPDRKQILLHRAFKDVASCVLGRVKKDHFGFVCRENGTDAYACYVFKCESDSIALEVVNAIKQAFVAHAELLKKSRDKTSNLTCEHCPMLWYHRLCVDVEGMNEKKTHAFILRRIEQLTENEQDQIIMKYQGGTNHMYEVVEHNAFLMMLLRAHCEAKQLRHVHDTAENRSEFLNQYLGGSTIFMKAKRSLSSGFDHLLKRRSSRDDGPTLVINIKKEPSPNQVQDSSPEPSVTGAHLTPEVRSRSKSLSPAVLGAANAGSDSPPSPTSVTVPAAEPTSDDDVIEAKPSEATSSPMMDIFLKVSDSRSSESADEAGTQHEATWRQAIYQKVQPGDAQEELSPMNLLGLQPDAVAGKRSREQLRQLWRMAIDQTVLLVRMEKENARLRENEQSSAVRRIKLEYAELGAVDAGVTLMWDSLLAGRNQQTSTSKVDHHMLRQAVIQGVPRVYRGNVWYFLAEQAVFRSPPPDPKLYPLYNTPYCTLLAGLTKHQHAILIDLGRTFPQHSYFASALGPGQLSLYNILKAYSLLDPEVGYCQGLSFVAGILLLHMEEADAFILLRHLMFRRGLRKQYLPDMSALQVQLYQLSRLLRDHEPELHAKLEALDISPALYAAPWMLTLFTSQFPLGFVVRVIDLIFLESLDIVFSVSLALLSVHKHGIMLCESCEEAAEYLKHKLPDINKNVYEKVMKKVHSLDISRQLADYAVEYGVLREEMPRVANLTATNIRLSADNHRMSNDLDSAMDAITNFQNTQTRLESQIKVMEHQLTSLSKYITAHHKQDLPPDLRKTAQLYTKRTTFGSKITSFSSKFTSNEEEDERPTAKSGASTPNLFAKISREDVVNATNRDKSRTSPETDRKPHFIMKKSLSVHSGLTASNLKQPLKILEETGENEVASPKKESLKDLTNTKKSFGTQEQVAQERMFEKQLKHDFDENLKRLDAKLSTNQTYGDLEMFKGKKSLSLNLNRRVEEQNMRNLTDRRVEEQNVRNLADSGFVTPLSPNDDKHDDVSVISHPLSDCDVDITFDGQLTKLKQIRPCLKQRTPSIDSSDAKRA